VGAENQFHVVEVVRDTRASGIESVREGLSKAGVIGPAVSSEIAMGLATALEPLWVQKYVGRAWHKNRKSP
jgi:hypothetical protein